MEETEKSISQNFHASVVDVAGLGILIKGVSGSGKTSLALAVLEYFSNQKSQAILVADDQILLSNQDGSLVAETPLAIAGKIEIYGFGILEVPYQNKTNVGLIVELIDQKKIIRMPEPLQETLLGVTLPALVVPKQHEQQGLRIITAWLKQHQII